MSTLELFTLCLSICSGRRYGSNSNLSGSMLIGDCRWPFEHIFHCGLIKPQNPGPAKCNKTSEK